MWERNDQFPGKQCGTDSLQEESGMMRLADTRETKKALTAELGTSGGRLEK